MLARWRTSWRALYRRAGWERDLDDELRSHLEHRIEDLIEGGLPREQAKRRARMEFGSSESHKEHCRAAHGLRWPDELRQDLRYAFRTALRIPGFTLVAVGSLALGLGANTVVFGVLNALLLRPLPVEEPEQLFSLQTNGSVGHSFPNYRVLRDQNRTFAELVGCRIAQMGLGESAGAQRVWGYLATGNYFKAMGIQPELGRFFGPKDDRVPGASPYAVLSYRSWQNRFGADEEIVGKSVHINTLPYTVLGVAPKGFHGTELFYWPEVWVPMMMQPQIEGRSWLDKRTTHNTWIVGRLKPGVSPQQAEADLNVIGAAIKREHTALSRDLEYDLASPGLVGDGLRTPVRAFAVGVMALSGLVLLAACVNLASLLGARTSDRFREIAIRVAVGAGRARIIRQLLTEAVLLAVVGGAAGWGMAVVLLRLLSQWRAPLGFPVQFAVEADLTTFVFVAVVSLATGLLFGIAPVRRAWGATPKDALVGGRVTGSAGRRWASRDLLLVVQVAACCVLVTGCVVSLRGLTEAASMDVGFKPDGVSVASFDLTQAGYSGEEGRAFQQRALAAATGLPGVGAAAYANSIPLSIDQSSTSVRPEGTADLLRAKGIGAAYYSTSPGFLSTIGIQLLAGRDFTPHDGKGSHRVAIVNQTFALKVFGTEDAIGRRFHQGTGSDLNEVIGIVADGKYRSLTESPQPAIFWPAALRYNPTTVLVVRSNLPATEVARQLQRALVGLDESLPLYSVGSVRQMLGFVLFPARAATVALGAFGMLALMLVVTGIYGLAAYAVSRRVREIGIRTAIGARPSQVLRFVLGRTLLLLFAGTCLGLALGLAASQALSNIVHHASALDPYIIAAVAVTMGAAGLAAAAAPARRVLGVDPALALRED